MAAASSPQTRGFLFADLRDYTRFAEQHGDAAATDLLRRYRLMVREVIARYDGAEIRTEGDSFYVVFGSVSVAVQAGVAILEAAAEVTGGSAPIRPGIGINAGETTDTDEGIVSTAVNVAARVCALAGPGELLVTDTVRALTRTYLDVRFLPRGAKRLKNIAEPIEIFRVVTQSASGTPTPRGWKALLAPLTDARRAGRLLLPIALVAVLGLSAVVAYAWLGLSGAGEREPSPETPPSDRAAGSPPSATPGGSDTSDDLTAEERDLVDRLPTDVAAHCQHASLSDGALDGSLASVVCRLPAGEPADTIWYDLMPTANQTEAEFASWPGAESLPPGDCSATVGRATGPWTLGVLSGLRQCFQDEAGADSWIVWTYQEPPVLARAVRSDLDWAGLFEWWRMVGPYLAVDPQGRN